ncbi:fatty acid synthase subunit alpha [Rhizoctonia solani AG-3 Rhs1AP]|uniref:Fatty acid synthase subunit alpha n=1 Tax=Rhizoctonia solani AG-3 Rhs1AP TaxID=1086054 RepID=X8J446_9AGAM|nr:fatty acid synthase subunit alpha [Rhizoctonia solani AG-3 Rhs1AP]
MRYLKCDSRAGARAYDEEKDNVAALQAKLDDIAKEHGDAYIQGIQPIFEPLKARHFNSSWNWVRQDALLMWYDIIFGRLTTVDREITSRCIAIMNRADPTVLRYMQYYIDNCHPEKGETYALAKQFGQQLIDNCREAIGQAPLYHDVTFPTAPKTEVNEKGDIIYSEVVREGVRKLEAYVEEMLWNVVKSQPEISQEQKSRIKSLYDGVVRSLRKGPESKPSRPVARTRRASSQFLRPQVSQVTSLSADKIPLLHLKRKVGGNWEYSSNLTGVYLDVLHEIATSGTSFKDKNALLTGVGKGSIGVEILKGLLQGGARVVITTSRYSRASAPSKMSKLSLTMSTPISVWILTTFSPLLLSPKTAVRSTESMIALNSRIVSCWSISSVSSVPSRTRRLPGILSLVRLKLFFPFLPTMASSATMVCIPSRRSRWRRCSNAGILIVG